MSTLTKRVTHRLAAVLAIATALATGGAGAENCYWAGGTSSDWGTVANWTTGNKVPDNDGAYFRSDKFHNNFKSGNRAYLVTFAAAHTNHWRTFFCKCGTASAPIILRANNATSGLTSGDTTETKRKKRREFTSARRTMEATPAARTAMQAKVTHTCDSRRERLRLVRIIAIGSWVTARTTGI